MKILVTGANGFVGKHLCRKLREQGQEVKEFRGDIRRLGDCKKNISGMEAVYHLAAVLDEEKGKEMREVNTKGTENIIEAALKDNVQQFIFLSTTGVMGNFHGKATEESPLAPRTLYEKTKAEGEKIVWESQEMLPITIVRSALVLGANSYWKKIVAAIKKGFPIIGNGKNLFQAIYVEDLADALVFMLGKQECIGEIFIAAEEKPKTAEQLVLAIKKELGMKQETKKMPLFLGIIMAYFFVLKSKITGKKTILLPEHVERFVRNRQYSIEKIGKLGWKPKYSTDQAVKETVKEILAEKFVE